MNNSGFRHPEHQPDADGHRYVRPGPLPLLPRARGHRRHHGRGQADDTGTVDIFITTFFILDKVIIGYFDIFGEWKR